MECTEDLLWQYCETENGVPVNGHDIIRAALTGYIRRIVIDGQGVVTDFGRKRRLFTGAAREALKLMLDGCEHIGCPVRPTSCQIDHINEWIRDGGTTDLANGALKCNGQNRAKHRLGITEQRDANGTLVQYRADGTPIIPVGRRLRTRTAGQATTPRPRFEILSTEQCHGHTCGTHDPPGPALDHHPRPPRRLTPALTSRVGSPIRSAARRLHPGHPPGW